MDIYFIIQEKHYLHFEQYYIAFPLEASICSFNSQFNSFLCFLLLKQQM